MCRILKSSTLILVTLIPLANLENRFLHWRKKIANLTEYFQLIIIFLIEMNLSI